MKLIEWLKTKLNAVVSRFKRSKPAPSVPTPYLPKLITLPAPDEKMLMSEAVKIVDSTIRHRISKLERLRRKHDKFVTPKGPPLEKHERPPRQPKPEPRPKPEPAPEEPLLASGNLLIADQHHDDRQGPKVLYKDSEFHGVFNFRDTILQQLELYFVYLRRMRKRDRDSYDLYRQIGAVVVPYLANAAHFRNLPDVDKPETKQRRLPAWFKQTRPSFGCFVFGADPETEKFEQKPGPEKKTEWWVPKFMYFFKYKQPPPEFEQMSGGDIYKMTVWWDRPFDKKFTKRNKGGAPQEFGVFVSADGETVTILRTVETKYIKAYSKKKHQEFHIPQRLWQIPEEYQEWARKHETDVKLFLSNIFIESVQRLADAQLSMIRVAASKNGMTAIFGVDVERTAYFFQDRDYHLTTNGQRKRIFHMVRPHERANGTQVGFHFRGERRFTWAGYNVMITVPGRDHYAIEEFNVGGHDEYWDRKGIDLKEIGKQLSDDIKHGIGRMT